MKKFVGILLISSYLFSAIELDQLLKIPLLIQHYHDHTKKNRSLSLFNFLFLHYSATGLKDEDENEDNKLPYKCQDSCINIASKDVVPDNYHKLILLIPMQEQKSYPAYADQFLSSQYLASVWQPPKPC